ncbi:MAG: ribonuclease J [Mariprofundaceae bacterium]|nr:ribonuclease J [Mariprofundaceae bacterium]
MSQPIRLFPFGGVGEFGKNMMVYAIGDEAIIVDCGMGFPGTGQYGIDVVIPDISALTEFGFNLRGLVLTHGHEDHIGAIPYLIRKLDVPMYASPITIALIKAKLDEAKIRWDIHPLPETGKIDVGPFGIEAIPVTHSIMDAMSIAIHTPYGAIIHTGDFKFDPSPVDGRATALHRFSALGDQGVLLLASDSTNATRSGSSPSERSVAHGLRQTVSECKGKVVVTTFASNMFRIQQIIDAAVQCGRKVIFAGRSIERHVQIANQFNRLNIPDGLVHTMSDLKHLEDHEVLMIATGSQGEFRAALARIAQGHMKGFKLKEGDLVVFSSSVIPGNEAVISALCNHIYRRGARIVHAGHVHLHVSGHAQAHELKTMMQLTRPRFFYPVHGEYRFLVEHQYLAQATGIPAQNTIIAENGQSVEVDADEIRLGQTFHSGAVFVDSSDEIDYPVLRDRRKLAEDGMVNAVVMISEHEGTLLGQPEIEAFGVLHTSLSQDILKQATDDLTHYLTGLSPEMMSDATNMREEVRVWLRRWFKRQIHRRPVVLAVILEI